MTKLETCIRNRKTAAGIAVSEHYRGIPSSPIVGEQLVLSLCKFKSVLIYRSVVVAVLVVVVVIVVVVVVVVVVHEEEEKEKEQLRQRSNNPNLKGEEKRIRNRKTAARMSAYEGSWGIPSSPIVGNKLVVSLCKELRRRGRSPRGAI